MAIQLQIRRGTTAENDVFTGAVGELTMDTDTNGVRVHDGTTAGGVKIPTEATADYVVEWQAPTDLNNYTWYRKYKSGWVEQGGISTGTGTRTVTLPIQMASSNYNITAMVYRANADAITAASYGSRTTTTFSMQVSTISHDSYTWNSAANVIWQVSGMAA